MNRNFRQCSLHLSYVSFGKGVKYGLTPFALVIALWAMTTFAAYAQTSDQIKDESSGYEQKNYQGNSLNYSLALTSVTRIPDEPGLIGGGISNIVPIIIGGVQYVLTASGNLRGMQIIDIGNPARPLVVANVVDSDNLKLHSISDIAVADINGSPYAIVVSIDNNCIHIIDIADPANPNPVATLTDNDNITLKYPFSVTTLSIDGNAYALVTSIGEGIQIVDITNPINPKPVANIMNDVDKKSLRAVNVITSTIDGAPYVLSTTTRALDIYIIDVSDISQPELVSRIGSSVTDHQYIYEIHKFNRGSSIAMSVIDDIPYALVSSTYWNNTQIYDVGDPLNSKFVSRLKDLDRDAILKNSSEFTASREITTTEIAGVPHALVAATLQGESGVFIYDIEEPDRPKKISQILESEDVFLRYAHAIATFNLDGDTYAVVGAAQEEQFQIFDIGDPAEPVPIVNQIDNVDTSLAGVNEMTTMTIDNTPYLLSISPLERGLQITDIGDLSKPVPIADITDTGDTVFENPKQLLSVRIDKKSYALILSSNDDTDSIQIIDIGDPFKPVALCGISHSDKLDLIDVRGFTTVSVDNKHYLLIESKESGVQVLNIGDPLKPTINKRDKNTLIKILSDRTNTFTVDQTPYAYLSKPDHKKSHRIQFNDNPFKPLPVVVEEDAEKLKLATQATTTTIGDKLYAVVESNNEADLCVIDITDPAHPETVACLTDKDNRYRTKPAYITTVAIDNRHYVIAVYKMKDSPTDLKNNIRIVDITDPSHPKPAVDPSGIEHLLIRVIGKGFNPEPSSLDELRVEQIPIFVPSGFVVEKKQDAYYVLLSFPIKGGIEVFHLDALTDN